MTGQSGLSEQQERAEHLQKLVHFASSYYVTPLFLLFAIADYIWYTDYFVSFLGLRIIAAFLTALINRSINRGNRSLKHLQILSTVFIYNCIWPIHLMMFLIPDASTPYYAGLVLIVAGMSVLRFTWGFYAFNLVQALAPLLLIGIWKDGLTPESHFGLNFIFLLSLSLIMTVSRVFSEKLHLREFESRVRLHEEIVSRDTVIRNKTEEALKLHALSRQFSPQIVSSVQSGKISLDGSIHRSEICAVFVDIVGSTTKFITLDRDDIQKILSMYMEDVMSTFLKYDITIDKFLGDGVLAFSNDPVSQSDYVERVLRAAVEILAKIQSKQHIYRSYWLSDFEVSFGIATGSASVGFYGSDLHVKSYTAIGRVVNLASRLGSAAGPNEILVSQDVQAKVYDKPLVVNGDIRFTDKGFGQLKGFETETIRLFAVETQKDLTQADPSSFDADQCPHGHGLLYLAQDASGIYEFRCRHCDFVLKDGETAKPNEAPKAA